jgi:hypothetical protein
MQAHAAAIVGYGLRDAVCHGREMAVFHLICIQTLAFFTCARSLCLHLHLHLHHLD